MQRLWHWSNRRVIVNLDLLLCRQKSAVGENIAAIALIHRCCKKDNLSESDFSNTLQISYGDALVET